MLSHMMRRLVLDTNIWLDWLVFDEAEIAPMRAALEAGGIEMCMDAACAAELERALGYRLGRIMLDEAAQADCLARGRATARFDWAQLPAPGVPLRLPACRDPDDQKFLALALACGADWLVTRDRALLETGRRWKKSLPFAIVTPRAWVAKSDA